MIDDTLSDAEKMGHTLRSLYIDEFAGVESWVCHNAKEVMGEKYKPAAPLSQKLKALREAASAETSRFEHPQHVGPLLELAARFSERRANLVHAKLSLAQQKDGPPLWLFRNAARPELADNEFSIIETPASLTKAIAQLVSINKRLGKQKLKPVAPTPASPAATSDKA